MKEVRTEIVINASPKKVWDFFSDFSRYPEWNPFIHSIQGNVYVGNVIRIELTPPDAKSRVFKPKVLRVVPFQEVRWLGHLIMPGLFDGEHIFELIDNHDGTTTFVQRERFSGILVPLLKKMLDDNTKRGFALMNQRLKERCE